MEDKILNKWKILEKNDAGSFAKIYKVTDENNNIFAIKKVSLPLSDDLLLDFMKSGYISRQEMNDFVLNQINKEIAILEKLKDKENILKLYEKNEENTLTGKNYYLRMEYATDIKKYFTNNNFTDDEVIKMAVDICTALEELEKNNIVHTDIKPGNIFSVNGTYKLGDFGTSVELNKEKPSTVFGTMNYMSPEVYKKEKIDFSTDIYSLGIVMYTLLNGKLPFVSSTTPSNIAFEKRMNGEEIPNIFGIKENLMKIIIKACSFDKEKRYKNASEMKNALLNINSVEPQKNVTLSPAKNKIIEMFTPDIKIKKEEPKKNEQEIKEFKAIEPIGIEPTISIYDTQLLNISKKNSIEITSKKKKNIFKRLKNSKIKKYAGLILAILLIPGVLFASYANNKTCDAGFINFGGKCVEGEYSCPDDYTLNDDNKCQKVKNSEDAKITKKCIDNENYLYDEETNLCKSIENVKIQEKIGCAIDGFKYNANTKKCEMTQITDAYPQYYCSSDYNLVGDTCVKETIVGLTPTSSKTCKSGYKMEGQKCVKNITETMDAFVNTECPSGYIVSTSNNQKCTKVVSTSSYIKDSYYSMMSCKSGYQKTSYSQCVRICDEGYQQNGNYCVKSCPSGYSLSVVSSGTYNCVLTNPVNKVTNYTCPDNWTKNGQTCTKTTKDIIDTTIEYNCKSGYNLNPIDNKCYSQNLDDYTDSKKAQVAYICVGGGRLNKSNNKCYNTVTQDSVTIPYCPEGYTIGPYSCIADSKDHPPVITYSCSRAYTLNGTKCESYTYKPATPVFY